MAATVERRRLQQPLPKFVETFIKKQQKLCKGGCSSLTLAEIFSPRIFFREGRRCLGTISPPFSSLCLDHEAGKRNHREPCATVHAPREGPHYQIFYTNPNILILTVGIMVIENNIRRSQATVAQGTVAHIILSYSTTTWSRTSLPSRCSIHS